MPLFDLRTIEPRELIPGFHVRFVHSERMTFAYWTIDEGAILPPHSHPHEQVAHVLEGTFELTIDGVTHTLHAGQIGVIPPNAHHHGKALTACRIIDAFQPVREDYLGEASAGVIRGEEE